MEHTDAGAHVGLADTCLPEYAFAGNSDIPPATTCPASPGAALASPCRGGGSGVPGGGTVPAGAQNVTDSDMLDSDTDITDDDITDDDITYSNVAAGNGVAPAPPASRVPLHEPVGRLAEVVELGLAGLFPEPMEWQERALCAQTDPEAFFPEKGGSTREAKRICSGCEVRPQCLEYALANDERFGIWGGMSERERRKQRRRAV